MAGATTCPLCGGANDCGTAEGKSTCWCFSATIAPEVLARVPDDQRNVSCVCRTCAEAMSRARTSHEEAMKKTSTLWFCRSGALPVPRPLVGAPQADAQRPGGDAVLESSPATLQLWFSEEPLLLMSGDHADGTRGCGQTRGAAGRRRSFAHRHRSAPRSSPAPIASRGRPRATTGTRSSGTVDFSVKARTATCAVTLDPAVITAIKSTTRAAVYGASALVVGAAVFQTLVLQRASGMSADERAYARTRARTIGYIAAWVLLLSPPRATLHSGHRQLSRRRADDGDAPTAVLLDPGVGSRHPGADHHQREPGGSADGDEARTRSGALADDGNRASGGGRAFP